MAVVDYLGITENDRIASLLPFSFDYGFNQLLCCVRTGATLVVETSPISRRIVETLRRQRTVLPAVPPLWLQLLSVEAFRTEQLEALRTMTNTGGRLPVDAVRRLRQAQPRRLGVVVSPRHSAAPTFRLIRSVRNRTRPGGRYPAPRSWSSGRISPLARLVRSANWFTGGRRWPSATGTIQRPQTGYPRTASAGGCPRRGAGGILRRPSLPR